VSTEQIIALAVVALLFSIVSVIGVSGVMARFALEAMRKPLQARVDAVYTPDALVRSDLRALSLGRESAGVWQGRGNGALVLTHQDLHFFQLVPQVELRLPLATITDLSFPHSHLGKTLPYKLLNVHFTSDGKLDTVAWYVPDLDGWKTAIATLRAQATPTDS
jgi:hypothetical protein